MGSSRRLEPHPTTMYANPFRIISLLNSYPFSDVFLDHRGGGLTPSTFWSTRSTYWHQKDGVWTLEVEMPGVAPKDLSVSADHDRITLTITRAGEDARKVSNETFHVSYPTKTTKGHPGAVRVSLKDGLARISVTEPKAEKPASVSIPVQSE